MDMILSVAAAGMAATIAWPLNYALFWAVWRREPHVVLGLVIGTVLSALIWAPPAIRVYRCWFRSIQRADPDKTFLWRIYWKAQFSACAITCLSLGMIAAIGIMAMATWMAVSRL